MERVARVADLDAPDDEIELIRYSLITRYIEAQFSVSDTLVELLTNGALEFLMEQVENIEKAHGIVLHLGDRELTVRGYTVALLKDVVGIAVPIVSQAEYLWNILLPTQRRILKEIEDAAADTGRAFKFSEFAALVNQTVDEKIKIFESAENSLSDFINEQLPMALDELRV